MPLLTTDLPGRVLAAGPTVPVLVLDTCALLDILRVPIRAADAKRAESVVRAASNVLAAVQGMPPRAHLLVAEVVLTEWSNNLPGVELTLTRHVSKLQADIDRLIACGSALGLPVPLTRSAALDASPLRRLAENLLATAHVVSIDGDIETAAFRRALRCIGPARKGKESLGDCAVAETLLRSVGSLRNAGFGGVAVFLSSNKEDFSNGGSLPHPDLEPDFKRLGIQWCVPWNHAVHAMGI